MRRKAFSPRNHRGIDDDWVPVAGEIVCVHRKGERPHLRMVIETYRDGGVRLRSYDPRERNIVVDMASVGPTRLTFQGPVCPRCGPGAT